VRLLTGLNRFENGQTEALAKGSDDRTRQRRTMLIKPKRCRLHGGLPVCESLANALIYLRRNFCRFADIRF
jgi:hypothetical protein